MSDLKEIFVRTERCTGCATCTIACAVAHSESKTLFGAMREKVVPRSRVYVEFAGPGLKVPVLCRHCEDAPCVNACISGAITRTAANTVVTDADKCIGCWTCVMVCPYGVIGRDKVVGKAFRCDRCPDLDTPACVSACPTAALVYDSVDAWAKAVRQKASGQMAEGQMAAGEGA